MYCLLINTMEFSNIKQIFQSLMDESTDDEVVLLSYYRELVSSITDMMRILEDKRQEVEKKISQLSVIAKEPDFQLAQSEAKQLIPEQLPEYDKTWKWAEKISYVLKKYHKPLKIAEIVEEIIELDELTPAQKQKIKNSVGATLSTDVKTGNTFKRSEGMRYWFK